MTSIPAAPDQGLTALAAQIAVHRQHSEPPYDLGTDVSALLAITADTSVLDIGCGTGGFLRQLTEHGHHGPLAGVDIRPAALAALADIPGVLACQASAQALPFADSTFTRVTALHVIYYLRDPAAALAEFARVTAPGGRIGVSVNHTQTAPRVRALVNEHARHRGLRPRPIAQLWAADTGDHLPAHAVPELMHRAYGNVAVLRRDNALVFRTPADLTKYAEVLLDITYPEATDRQRAQIRQQISDTVNEWFLHHRQWRDPKGYTVATSIPG